METQTGRYTLYRQTASAKQKLSFINGNRKVGFDYSSREVLFNLVNKDGYAAKFLVTNRVYFPRVKCNGEDLYFYATDKKDEFLLSSSNQLQGRLFLFFPPGSVYTFDCNLSGHFFIHGVVLSTSEIASFNSSLTDLIFIEDMRRHSKILAKDCQADCKNKKCTDDDGCGLPCGCPEGKVCVSSGECLDKDVPTIPLCGEHFGLCPDNSECVQKEDGRYHCKRTEPAVIPLWVTILVLVILAILIILIFIWLKCR